MNIKTKLKQKVFTNLIKLEGLGGETWDLYYKHFTAVIYRFCNKLECLSLASLFNLV
jgi:hypothetical protein